MTRHERRALGRAVTHVWRAALAVADNEPQVARRDVEEALRVLVRLLPDGGTIIHALAASAGPAGLELARALRQEAHDEPARQRRLALGDPE